MSDPLWFTGVRIIDVIAGRTSERQSIAVEDGTIAAISLNPPIDADHIPVDGLFMAPGLIDAHVHFFLAGDVSPAQTFFLSSDEQKLATAESNARIALESGITTMRDCGAPAALMAEFRARIARNAIPAPNVVSCGAPLTRPSGHLHFLGEQVRCEQDVCNAVHRQLSSGHEFIKLIASGGGLTPDTDPAEADLAEDLMRTAVEMAHRSGATVAAHCHATESIRRAVDVGVDVIEHASFVTRQGYFYDAPLACRLRDAGTVISPTVTGALRSAAELRRSGRPYNQSDRGAVERLEGRLRNSAHFRELGIKIVAGTDAGITNTRFDSLLDELRSYVAVGFSPAEALRTATSDSAEYLHLGKRGQLRVGWQADLLLLDANPLENLEVLRKPVLVMKKGQIVFCSSDAPGLRRFHRDLHPPANEQALYAR